MKHLSFIFLFALLISCSGNKPKEEVKTSAQLRAETDTTLVFQGIELGQPLDTAKFNALQASLPMKLYNSENKEFTFIRLEVDTLAIDTDSHNVQSVSVYNLCSDEFYPISLVSFYEEKYGLFSYYEALKGGIKSYGKMFMGEKNVRKGEGAYQRIDAVNNYFEIRHFPEGDDFEYRFVWEWKNQRILIKCYPKWSRTTIMYENCGYEKRIKSESDSKAAAEKAEQEKNQAIEEAKEKQQI